MQVGFCVIYRFKIRPGFEETFRDGWTRMTMAIRDQRGGLGSRLHLADDGWWVAYAQWPDRDTFERSQSMPSPETAAAQRMADAIEERKPPIMMEAEIDMFLPTAS